MQLLSFQIMSDEVEVVQLLVKSAVLVRLEWNFYRFVRSRSKHVESLGTVKLQLHLLVESFHGFLLVDKVVCHVFPSPASLRSQSKAQSLNMV